MTLATKELSYDRDMHFPFQQGNIARTKYQSFYLSPIYLPNEFKMAVSKDSIQMSLKYDFYEPSEKLNYSKHISITQGQNTKRVFAVLATFGDSSFKVMLKRFEDIVKALEDLRKKAKSKSYKKSLSLILDFLGQIKSEIIKDREELEFNLFS